jgi:uncharacterized damage-inducible protein DinB
MRPPETVLIETFRAEVRSYLEKYLQRIVRCLQLLSEEEIWRRPNSASNTAGNVVLHLCGNVRQWVTSGIGGDADLRERDKEFAETGPIERQELIENLKSTVEEALETIDRVPVERFARELDIQGYRVTGMIALARVYAHFSYHAGQIIYLTKLTLGEDLHFTKLPDYKADDSRDDFLSHQD